MLKSKEMRKMGSEYCKKNMYTEAYTRAFPHSFSTSYGYENDGLFSYALLSTGMAPEEEARTLPPGTLMGGETPMPFCAYVLINPTTGEIKEVPEYTRLPEKND